MTTRRDWELLARTALAERERMIDAVDQISRFAREYERRMAKRANEIVNAIESIRTYQSRIVNNFDRVQATLHKAWEEAARVDLERLRRGMEEAARRRKKALIEFAQRGWYQDPELPVTAPEQLLNALREDEDGSVAAAIEDYFEDRIDGIEETLVSSFPNREAVLRDGFEAHRASKYNLSIPVFLAQADGMWWDHFHRSLFTERDRQHVASSEMPSDDSFQGSMTEVFRVAIPLWMPRNQREDGFSEFNRHQVMHGESTGYGTRANSLKAISFLAFLQFLLKPVDDEDD